LLEYLGLRRKLLDDEFGSCFAIPTAGSNREWGETKMGILILKVLAMWSLVALVAGLGLGAAISRGERVRKDEFLSCVFASLENLQASRS
jgi:hypothetical protein